MHAVAAFRQAWPRGQVYRRELDMRTGLKKGA
jgi:hypothetical protein